MDPATDPGPIEPQEPGVLARAFQLPVTPGMWRRAQDESLMWVVWPLAVLSLALSMALGAYRGWQSEGVLRAAISGYDERFDAVVYERGTVRVLGDRLPRFEDGDLTMLVDPDETVAIDDITTGQFMVLRADRVVMQRSFRPREEVPLAELAELLGDGPIVVNESTLLDWVERWSGWVQVGIFALVAGFGFVGDVVSRPLYAGMVAAIVQPWLSQRPGSSFLVAFKVALATSSLTLLAGLVLHLGGAGAGCLGPFLWPFVMLLLTTWSLKS
jgi:hypothetical protein